VEEGPNSEKTIAELFLALDECMSNRPVSLATLERAKELAKSWQPKFGAASDALVLLLAGLVAAQKREIEDLVMDALLSEPPRKRRGRVGRPPRKVWLSDLSNEWSADWSVPHYCPSVRNLREHLRSRVLRGIEARINSVCTSEHIKSAFLKVIRRHLPSSGRK